ncbi:MAG: hypothetical protein P8177_07935, partial [Gemmatimonadota bacterium]
MSGAGRSRNGGNAASEPDGVPGRLDRLGRRVRDASRWLLGGDRRVAPLPDPAAPVAPGGVPREVL